MNSEMKDIIRSVVRYFNLKFDINKYHFKRHYDVISDEFNTLYNIYENRHMYKYDWAFERLEESYSILTDKLSQIYDDEEDTDTIDKLLHTQKSIKDYLIHTQRKYRLFLRYIKYFISSIEVLFSVIIVLSVSEVSHRFQEASSTLLISLSIAIVFALIKILIERSLLNPIVESYAWKKYLNILEEPHKVISIYIGILYITKYYMNTGMKIEEIINKVRQWSYENNYTLS